MKSGFCFCSRFIHLTFTCIFVPYIVLEKFLLALFLPPHKDLEKPDGLAFLDAEIPPPLGGSTV